MMTKEITRRGFHGVLKFCMMSSLSLRDYNGIKENYVDDGFVWEVDL